MSDLRNIQQIYESGYRGVSIDTPLTNYSPPQERQAKTTYRRPPPTTSPDKVDRALAYNPTVAAPIEYEESDLGEIRKDTVLKLLDAKMQEAASSGMDYCMYVLGQLKETINAHKEG